MTTSNDLHQFFYDSPGIRHDSGQHEQLDIEGLGLRDVWACRSGSAGKSIWYGPGSVLVANGSVRFQWLYCSKFQSPTRAIFSIVHGPTGTSLYQSTRTLIQVAGVYPAPLYTIETDLNLIGTFDNLQLRVKPETISGVDAKLYLYKTTYQPNPGL